MRLCCPWGFSRQEYWSRFPGPPPRDLPNPGIEHRSPALQVDFLPSEPPGKPIMHWPAELQLFQMLIWGPSWVAQLVKNLLANAGDTRDRRFNPWVRKIPWRRAWQPTPVFLPGESPWTEEPGGLQSMGSQRVRHN